MAQGAEETNGKWGPQAVERGGRTGAKTDRVRKKVSVLPFFFVFV